MRLPPSMVISIAVALTACSVTDPVATILPVASAHANVQASATTWTLSAIAAPTTGAGVGEAVLDNGMAVGRRGSAGFSSPGTGTGSVLPPATGFSDAHTYDVALVAGNLIAVGYSGTSEGSIPSRATYWRLNSVGAPLASVDMGLAPGLKGAIARGINSKGEIVGYGFVTPGTFSAWRRSATGVLSVISSVGVTAAVAEDINDKSTAVGVSTRTNGTIRAFRWPVISGEFTIMQALAPLTGHTESNAYAVNLGGTVVGYSSGTGGRVAVKWNSGSTVAVDLGLGANSEAREINSAGYILVRRPSGGGGREIVVVAPSGSVLTLPSATTAGFYEAWGLNSCGDVVGSGPTSAGQPSSMTAIRWTASPCVP